MVLHIPTSSLTSSFAMEDYESDTPFGSLQTTQGTAQDAFSYDSLSWTSFPLYELPSNFSLGFDTQQVQTGELTISHTRSPNTDQYSTQSVATSSAVSPAPHEHRRVEYPKSSERQHSRSRRKSQQQGQSRGVQKALRAKIMPKTPLDLSCAWKATENLKTNPDDRVYDCHDTAGKDMSDVRTHGRNHHKLFCRLCPHCQDEILDEEDFSNNHGFQCKRKKVKQRKRADGQRAQWTILFQNVARRKGLSHLLPSTDADRIEVDVSEQSPPIENPSDINQEALPTAERWDVDMLTVTSGPQTALLDSRSQKQDSSASHSPQSSIQMHAPLPDALHASDPFSASSDTCSIGAWMSDLPWSAHSRLGASDTTTSTSDVQSLSSQSEYVSLHRDANTASCVVPVEAESVWTSLALSELDMDPFRYTMPSQLFAPNDTLGSRLSISDHHSTVASTSTASAPDSVICHICGTEFSGRYRSGNLARHRRLQHNGSRIFGCPDSSCIKVFKRQDARLKHVRKHHPGLVPDVVPRPTRNPRRPHASDQNLPSETVSEVAQTESLGLTGNLSSLLKPNIPFT